MLRFYTLTFSARGQKTSRAGWPTKEARNQRAQLRRSSEGWTPVSVSPSVIGYIVNMEEHRDTLWRPPYLPHNVKCAREGLWATESLSYLKSIQTSFFTKKDYDCLRAFSGAHCATHSEAAWNAPAYEAQINGGRRKAKNTSVFRFYGAIILNSSDFSLFSLVQTVCRTLN